MIVFGFMPGDLGEGISKASPVGKQRQFYDWPSSAILCRKKTRLSLSCKR